MTFKATSASTKVWGILSPMLPAERASAIRSYNHWAFAFGSGGVDDCSEGTAVGSEGTAGGSEGTAGRRVISNLARVFLACVNEQLQHFTLPATRP